MKRNFILIVVILVSGALAQALWSVLPPYLASLFLLAGINAILAVSLNLVNGLSGQFSLGHNGFMAIGAYVAAAVTSPATNWLGLARSDASGPQGQAMFLLALVLAGLAAALAGWLVGLPSLRLRGDYLAIVTLGFGEIIRVVFLNIQSLGGARGLSDIPPFSNAFVIVGFLAACALATHRFIKSSHGRALLSIREDEIAAAAMGVNTTRYKVGAFVASAAAAGVAGGLFAHYLCFINPASFTFLKSVEIVIMVVLGGLGSVSGSILAAILLTLLPEALRPLQQITGLDLRMVIYSLLLIIIMILRPKGMFGRREIWHMFKKP